jgi:hypothetical protein
VVFIHNGQLQTPVLHFLVHLQGRHVPWAGVFSMWSCAPPEVFRITFHLVLVTDHKPIFLCPFCSIMNWQTSRYTSQALLELDTQCVEACHKRLVRGLFHRDKALTVNVY